MRLRTGIMHTLQDAVLKVWEVSWGWNQAERWRPCPGMTLRACGQNQMWRRDPSNRKFKTAEFSGEIRRRRERPREGRADKSLWSQAWRNSNTASLITQVSTWWNVHPVSKPSEGSGFFLTSSKTSFPAPPRALSSICALFLLLSLMSYSVQLPKAVSHQGWSLASLPLPHGKWYHLRSYSFALHFHLGMNPCQDIKVTALLLLCLFAF